MPRSRHLAKTSPIEILILADTIRSESAADKVPMKTCSPAFRELIPPQTYTSPPLLLTALKLRKLGASQIFYGCIKTPNHRSHFSIGQGVG